MFTSTPLSIRTAATSIAKTAKNAAQSHNASPLGGGPPSYKVAVIGERYVGKSTIVSLLLDGRVPDRYYRTIGASMNKLDLAIGGDTSSFGEGKETKSPLRKRSAVTTNEDIVGLQVVDVAGCSVPEIDLYLHSHRLQQAETRCVAGGNDNDTDTDEPTIPSPSAILDTQIIASHLGGIDLAGFNGLVYVFDGDDAEMESLHVIRHVLDPWIHHNQPYCDDIRGVLLIGVFDHPERDGNEKRAAKRREWLGRRSAGAARDEDHLSGPIVMDAASPLLPGRPMTDDDFQRHASSATEHQQQLPSAPRATVLFEAQQLAVELGGTFCAISLKNEKTREPDHPQSSALKIVIPSDASTTLHDDVTMMDVQTRLQEAFATLARDIVHQQHTHLQRFAGGVRGGGVRLPTVVGDRKGKLKLLTATPITRTN